MEQLTLGLTLTLALGDNSSSVDSVGAAAAGLTEKNLPSVNLPANGTVAVRVAMNFKKVLRVWFINVLLLKGPYPRSLEQLGQGCYHRADRIRYRYGV